MDFNRLTQKSQEAFAEAQNKAVNYGHVEVDGEHLLWALLTQPDGLVPRLLQRMDIRPEMLKKEIESELDRKAACIRTGRGAGESLCFPASLPHHGGGRERSQTP